MKTEAVSVWLVAAALTALAASTPLGQTEPVRALRTGALLDPTSGEISRNVTLRLSGVASLE